VQTQNRFKKASPKPIASFLILFLLAFLVIKTAYGYNAKIEPTTRFKLSTSNTYIYFDQSIYVDYAYVYTGNVTATNIYMSSGSTLSTFTIAALQGNLTVTKLMESSIIEATGVASTGDWSEFYMQIPTLDEPVSIMINSVEVPVTSNYVDYVASSEDAWYYYGSGKIILKGIASSTVTFMVDWTTLPYAEYEAGVSYAVNLFNIPIVLGERLSVGTFAGGLIASSIVLMMTLLPVTIINRSRKGGGGIIAELIIGLAILGVCVAITWFPIWIYVLLCFLVALLFNGEIRGKLGV